MEQLQESCEEAVMMLGMKGRARRAWEVVLGCISSAAAENLPPRVHQGLMVRELLFLGKESHSLEPRTAEGKWSLLGFPREGGTTAKPRNNNRARAQCTDPAWNGSPRPARIMIVVVKWQRRRGRVGMWVHSSAWTKGKLWVGCFGSISCPGMIQELAP